jgi:hypothetical protein
VGRRLAAPGGRVSHALDHARLRARLRAPGFVLLAGFFTLDDGRERRWLGPLALLGSTAFFYYVLHVHLLLLAGTVLQLDPERYGLAKTYVGAAAVLAALYPLCVRYRRYKAAHPDGWTRYV